MPHKARNSLVIMARILNRLGSGFWTTAMIMCSLIAVEGEESFRSLERQFHQLPMETRRWTGPLFWLHGDESRERLEMYAEKVAEGGNGAFTTESRPHNDWLGPGWWRDLDICLAAAKKHHLKLWIFDEKWWPSQGVGGNVPPRYAAKQLVATAIETNGPVTFKVDHYAGEDFIAAVAGRVTPENTIDAESLVDLESFIQKGNLTWPAPSGRWRIMKFTHKTAPGLGQGGGKELSVDGLSQDCVNWYLQTVYQPHYDRYKADFGRTIAGFFYDEPETRGDWGTALNSVLAERQVDWKKAYVAYKFQLAGEAQTSARYQYLDARAEAWGRTMYGGITRWCEQRGVKSIGHFMEHANMYMLQDFCGGDLMRLQKYSSMGGIDAVFAQFKPGQRAAYDPPCWQTPKLGSSITHAYGKPNDVTMVEIFGARGQDLSYPEMKWWADAMHAAGVNFLIPHSFNPRAPYDTDCPPYFYNGGFEPRWPLYRVFADYTSRLNLMLTGGRHVAPVALLFQGQSAHVGRSLPPDQMSEALQDALYDCDWLPYEVFEHDASIARKTVNLRQESYKILVVPAVEAIPYPTLNKAKEFFDAGGVVVGHGFLPTQSATPGKTSADISRLRDAVWGAPKPGLTVCKTSSAGGRSFFLPEKPTPEQLQQVLAGEAQIRPTLEVIEGRTDHWLHVLHRVKAGRDIFFVANQNHIGEPRRFRFRITAQGTPECWDPMRNEITAIPCTRQGGQVELALTMQPNESMLLVFQSKKRSLPLRAEPGTGAPSSSITITRVTNPPAPEPKLEDRGRKTTLSPVKADPFAGRFDFPSNLSRPKNRIVLELDNLAPEMAARVTINDHFAGGLISQPLRLDVTAFMKPGANTIRIEPFAPRSARLVVYPVN